MFWLPIIWIVVTVIAMVANYYLQPKPQKRGPGELQAPVCEQGYPIAYVAGCAKIRGVNVVWKGAPKAQPKNKGMMYDYYVNLMLGICQGTADRCRRIWFQSDTIPTILGVTKQENLSVPKNIVGITNVVVYDEGAWPYPEGLKAIVGDQDAHLGAIILMMTTRTFGNVAATVLAPEFWVYSNVEARSATDPNFQPHYKWVGHMPNIYDTVIIDRFGYCFFDGASWMPTTAPTQLSSKLMFSVKVDNQEKGCKVQGLIRWYDGSAGQLADPDVKAQARNGGATPTYDGLCYAVLVGNDKFYWGESPNIPEVSFEIERIPDPLGLGTKSYIAGTTAPAHDGGSTQCRDANPANILYEWLTSTSVGIGASPADINVTSFRDAGRILWHEGVAITMVIDKQVSFDDASKEIMMVTDGVLYEDPATGLWTFRLIREPLSASTATAWGIEDSFYTRTDWPVFDEDDFTGDTEFTRGSWGDVANQIKVQFMDRKEGYAQRVVDVQDIANYMTMGELVTVQNTYNSVNSRDLAIRLAYRDLRTLGTPRAKLKDEISGRAWKLRPGDCFVVNRPALGISNMRFRVLTIRYGTMENRRVAVEAVEDVFGMPDTVYSEPGSGWVDPTTIPPTAPAAARAWELAYNVTGDGPRVGFAALVARGSEDTTGAILYAIVGGSLQRIGPIDYTPSALLTPSLAVEEWTQSIQLQGVVDAWAASGNALGGRNLALIDNEVIAFDGVGRNADGTIYLSNCLRGALDTIPRTHSPGARVWLIRQPPTVQAEITTIDHSETFTIQATSAGGETSIVGADLYGGTTDSRELRPFVPGKFRVGGATTLEASVADQIVTGDVAVSWATRNRLTQAPGVVAQDADSIDDEAGQFSRMRLQKGIGLSFNPYLPASMGGGAFPFGTQVQFVGQPSNWIDLRETVWLDAIGIKDYGDWLGAAPAFSATMYLYISIDGATYVNDFNDGAWTYGYDYSGLYTGRIYLFRAVWVWSGGNAKVTLYDLRSMTVEATIVDSETATSGAIAPSAVATLGLDGMAPNRVTVDAHRDGLDSMEERASGLLFDAGYGMNYGNFYGGSGT